MPKKKKKAQQKGKLVRNVSGDSLLGETQGGTGIVDARRVAQSSDSAAGTDTRDSSDLEESEEELEEETEPEGFKMPIKLDPDNPFPADPLSYQLYSSIVDKKDRRKITGVLERLQLYSENHHFLLGQGSKMSYSELLMGMLFENEEVVPVPPLLVKNYMRVNADTGEVEDQRFGARLYLTNRRIFLLDSSLHKVPTLMDDPEVFQPRPAGTAPASRISKAGTFIPTKDNFQGFMLMRKLNIDYIVKDEVWYYPIPLNLVKGIELDIHYETIAHGWLYQKRPLLIVIIIAVAAAYMISSALYAIPPAALIGSFTPGETVDSTSSQSLINESFGGSLSGDNQTTRTEPEPDYSFSFLTLFTGIGGIVATPIVFLTYPVYSRSDFKPRMTQTRTVTFGALDPIEQRHTLYKLDVDDRYSMTAVKDYLHLLQEYSPYVNGQVLE
jgi:hypothetical protein